MRRLIIVYNPRSSRHAEVKKSVLDKVSELNGYMVGKFEVQKGNVDDNAGLLAKFLKDGDMLVVAGGDATGAIAANGILKSGKDITLGVLPFGNFNDLSRTSGIKTLEEILDGKKEVRNFYPLEIQVDGKLFRYATCYTTIGMMADAIKIYDQPKMRKILKKTMGRNVVSYTSLAGWYLKNRRKKDFLPEFKLNGVLQSKKVSDYVAVNGRYVARVMKGDGNYLKQNIFRSGAFRLTCFWRLFGFMAKSIFGQVPGKESSGDVLEFENNQKIKIQAEGEYRIFDNVKKIEIKKSARCLKVITR